MRYMRVALQRTARDLWRLKWLTGTHPNGHSFAVEALSLQWIAEKIQEGSPCDFNFLHAMRGECFLPSAGFSGADERYFLARVFGAGPLVGFLFFELTHAIRRTPFNGRLQPFPVGLNPEEFRDFSGFADRVREQILVANQQKRRITMAGRDPTRGVFPPGPIGTGRSGDETFHELFERHIRFDVALLQIKVVLRNCNVARIAHQIDDFLEANIEGLMTLHDARPRQRLQKTLR